MATEAAVKFIRKNGKVIPIREGGARIAKAAKAAVKPALIAAKTAGEAGAVAVAGKTGLRRNPNVKVNRALDLTGLGISVASGALAAATFSHGAKGFAAGHLAAHAIDVGGVAANVASVSGGKASKGAKAKQAAKQEARNVLIGNAVYAAGVFGFKKNREAGVKYVAKGLQYAKKVLDLGRKALRVI